jgi:Domain of unknown function (DUF5666)
LLKGKVLSAHQSASGNSGDKSEGQDSSHNDGPQTEGTVTSIDSGHSSFKLTLEHGDAISVVVNGQTEFDGDGDFQGFSDLKVGLSVEVKGNSQSNGTIAATRVHREDTGSGDGSSNGGDNGSGSRSGDGGTSGGNGSTNSGTNGSDH